MRNNNLFLKTVFVLATSALIVTSCKKEDEFDENDITTAADHSYAESSFNDVGNMADEASLTGNISYRVMNLEGALSSCVIVTKDTLTDMTRVVTIDFGTGCVGNDGRTRKGKIIVKFTGHYFDSAATKTITLENYFVNDNQIIGTRTVRNNGHNSAGNLSWTITEQGSVVLASSAGTITWNSSRTRELTNGESTLIISDDIYSITGSVNGINAKGIAFSAEIINPLIRKMSLGCRKHFVQGTILLKPTGKPERTIDFGNGDCDNIATVTVNGQTKQVTLK